MAADNAGPEAWELGPDSIQILSATNDGRAVANDLKRVADLAMLGGLLFNHSDDFFERPQLKLLAGRTGSFELAGVMEAVQSLEAAAPVIGGGAKAVFDVLGGVVGTGVVNLIAVMTVLAHIKDRNSKAAPSPHPKLADVDLDEFANEVVQRILNPQGELRGTVKRLIWTYPGRGFTVRTKIGDFSFEPWTIDDIDAAFPTVTLEHEPFVQTMRINWLAEPSVFVELPAGGTSYAVRDKAFWKLVAETGNANWTDAFIRAATVEDLLSSPIMGVLGGRTISRVTAYRLRTMEEFLPVPRPGDDQRNTRAA